MGRYLDEFLMDPYVVDIPFPFRWLLVRSIVPKRRQASSELYKKVWSPRGSPLLLHSEDLTSKVKDKWDGPVELAMRYGEPGVFEGLERLKEAGADRIIAFPLYPQYSLAATESSKVAVKRAAGELGLPVSVVEPFYQSPYYLNAVAEVSAPYLKKKVYDFVLFSFHGLPERQVRKTDPTRGHCLKSDACCDIPNAANVNCYRHQCYMTAKWLAERLHINPLRYAVAFQSRLGRTPWIRPYSDQFYETFPQRGIKRLMVLCPSFVADCLETVEEVEIRGSKQFKEAGGEALTLVPSLNATDAWAEAVVKIAEPLLNDSSTHSPT